MARLDTRLSSSSAPRQIPWKVIALLCCIGSIWGFMAYKYVQYRVPSRTLAVPVNQQKALAGSRRPANQPQRARPQPWMQAVQELNLTDAQKEQIKKIAAETTVPKVLRSKISKVLTPEQRDKLTSRLKELAAQRAQQQKARADRETKYYGSEVEYARRANQVMRQQREARRLAAQAAKQTTASQAK